MGLQSHISWQFHSSFSSPVYTPHMLIQSLAPGFSSQRMPINRAVAGEPSSVSNTGDSVTLSSTSKSSRSGFLESALTTVGIAVVGGLLGGFASGLEGAVIGSLVGGVAGIVGSTLTSGGRLRSSASSSLNSSSDGTSFSSNGVLSTSIGGTELRSDGKVGFKTGNSTFYSDGSVGFDLGNGLSLSSNGGVSFNFKL